MQMDRWSYLRTRSFSGCSRSLKIYQDINYINDMAFGNRISRYLIT